MDTIRRWWLSLGEIPVVRTGLFALGCLLMIVSPIVGAIPGPGGIFVFAAGLALALKYSQWAKRQYARFKRKRPRLGRWADRGLGRRSARRRAARRKTGQGGTGGD
ncbi:MAG: hypothetical protein ACFBQW_08045 [Sphingomonadaceae bacterium]